MSLDTAKKSLALSYLHPAVRYVYIYICIDKIPLSLVSSRLNCPSSLSLILSERWFNP